MKRIILGLVCLAMLSGVSFAREKVLIKDITLPTGATAGCWQTVREQASWIVKGENKGKIERVEVVMYGWIDEAAYVSDKEAIATRIKVYETVEEVADWKNECNKMDKEAKKHMKETEGDEFYGATDGQYAGIPGDYD